MKQRAVRIKAEDLNRQLTYIKHKDNFPLELKGNMRRKIEPQHHERKIPCIKTSYQSSKANSLSSGSLTPFIMKSNCWNKEKKHYLVNPETLIRYQKIQKIEMKSQVVSQARLRKILEDYEDKVCLEDNLNGEQKSRSVSQETQIKVTGKKHFMSNLFIESETLGRDNAKKSMRKANLNRTKSTIVLH